MPTMPNIPIPGLNKSQPSETVGDAAAAAASQDYSQVSAYPSACLFNADSEKVIRLCYVAWFGAQCLSSLKQAWTYSKESFYV